jgi:ATP-dependent RNA helicase DDX10/DBP4
VRFVFELFRSMQPGIPLTALHGKIKQERRTLVYMDFLRKKAACMFATDIASRGLDFPNIDWVVSLPSYYYTIKFRTERTICIIKLFCPRFYL